MSERTNQNELIRCEQVSLAFAGRSVIQNFNLTISNGDRIAFLGPSGCGKSTLLNLISGLLEPDSGEVFRKVPQEKMSFVFQDASLFPWKTVRENVVLVNELVGRWGLSQADLSSRIHQLLTQVGLADREHAYPDELSGGMKMRVALARALVNSPQLLLLDEPFAALDDPTRERLQDDLLKLQAGNASAFVLVTHNIEEALVLCRRVFVFAQDGKILRAFERPESSSDGSVQQLRESEEIRSLREEIRSLWGVRSVQESAHA